MLSPASRKRSLLAKVPTDPGLLANIKRKESGPGLNQEEPTQDSYIMTRLEKDVVHGQIRDTTYSVTHQQKSSRIVWRDRPRKRICLGE